MDTVSKRTLGTGNSKKNGITNHRGIVTSPNVTTSKTMFVTVAVASGCGMKKREHEDVMNDN